MTIKTYLITASLSQDGKLMAVTTQLTPAISPAQALRKTPLPKKLTPPQKLTILIQLIP